VYGEIPPDADTDKLTVVVVMLEKEAFAVRPITPAVIEAA
jgi:hypothetical protein